MSKQLTGGVQLGPSGGFSSATFTQLLKFDSNKIMTLTQSGTLAFSIDASGAVAGNGIIIEIISDGINVPSFVSSLKKLSTSDSWDNTLGQVHIISVLYTGNRYIYSISKGDLVTGLPALEFLTSGTTAGGTITESPSHTFGSGSDAYIVFSKKMAAGSACRYQWEYQGYTSIQGLDSNNTANQIFAGTWQIGTWTTTNFFVKEGANSSVDKGAHGLNNGDLVSLNCTDTGTVTLEKSTNGGTSWTVVHTFSGTYAAIKYIKSFVSFNNPIVNSKGYNVS